MIVILGILSVVALPRFIDLQGEAQQAAAKGVAGALGSAAAINYAAHLVGNPDADSAIEACESIGALLSGGLPNGYEILEADISGSPGSTAECTVSGEGAATATFTGIRTADPE